jgi:murein DD-endopeptidase MepM/ murein hydrolase activator NlpD
LTFVNRHLTAISVGVLVVGVVLVGVGPVRGMLNRQGDRAAAAPDEASPDEEGAGQIAFLQGTGGGDAELPDQVLDREPQPFTIVPNRQRDEVVTYTVQAGDTVFDLADRFGLNMETIFWANAETLQDNVHLLVPGIEIFVLPTNGIYYRATGEETITQIAEKFYADPDAILDDTYNELPGDSDGSFVPPLGMRLVVPGGEREAIDFSWVAPAPASAASPGGASQRILFAPGHAGSCNTVVGGGAGTGAFGSPIGSYSVTQGYFYGHNGIDLSSVIGEPVYAADAGIVVFAGWNDWGYGNLVAINHGTGGWTTLYGHLNSVSVGCGQTVSRGTPIGSVGSTGNSSGPHLHFEMRWGLGLSPDNPAAYIGF